MPKISALPPMTTAADDDEAPIVDTSATTTKKWTLTLLKTYLQALVGWITTAMLGDDQVTPAKSALFNYQTDNSNSIASVSNGDIKIQAGWAQAVGNNTQSFSTGVTFPTAFTTVLGVVIQLNSVKATTAASSIGDLNAPYNTGGTTFAVSAGDITTSGFNAYLGRNASTFSSSTYYGFSWIAWGIM